MVLLAIGLSGCMSVVSELKAARNPHVESLHEQLLRSIHDNGFSHDLRIARDSDREIDTIFVAIPLDSLKRRYITLHHMLFNVARLCARPEYSDIAIAIELNANDEKDRAYLLGIVGPIVAESRNVSVVPQREDASDLIITLSGKPGNPVQ